MESYVEEIEATEEEYYMDESFGAGFVNVGGGFNCDVCRTTALPLMTR